MLVLMHIIILKGPRLWDLSTKRSPPEMRRDNGSLRKLKKSNQKSIAGVLQLRWGILTSVRGVYHSR